MNYQDPNVKEWVRITNYSLVTNENSALFHIHDVVNEGKDNNLIWIYDEKNDNGWEEGLAGRG